MYLKSVKIYLGTDFNWTLTFDLDVFFDKSIDDRLSHSKWSKVSVIDNEQFEVILSKFQYFQGQ